MNVFAINTAIFDAIGLSLLHTTWISTTIVLLMMIVLKLQSAKSSSWKAGAVVAAMVSILSVFFGLFTYFVTDSVASPMPNNMLFEAETMLSPELVSSQSAPDFMAFFMEHKQFLFTVWMIGAFLFLLKFVMSFLMVSYVRKLAILEPSSQFVTLIEKVSQTLNYKGRTIKLGYSGFVSSPIVSGFFKPIIIFPVGLINQLTMNEVEAVIAHEVSHLLRKDYLANFLIVALEILFYYNPAIWWLNNQLKKYREEDCDDRAVSVIGSNISYIKTLVKVQELSLNKPNSFSLALNGNNESNFYKRIKRLMNMDIKSRNVKSHFAALGLLLLIGVFYAQTNVNANTINETEDYYSHLIQEDANSHFISSPFAETAEATIDSIPSKNRSTTKIIQKTDDQEVEMEMENGEITNLVIDGRKVPKEEYEKHTELMENLGRNNSLQKLRSTNRSFNFEFPEMPEGFGDSFALMFDGDNNRFFGGGHRLDSLINRFQNDSMMIMHFENGFPQMRMFENLDMEGFPEGMDWNEFSEGFEGLDFENLEHFEFPQNFHFDMKNFDNDRQNIDLDELRHRNNEGFGWNRNDQKLEDVIGAQLNKDGFLIPNKENTVLLTGKYLKINGEKQPSTVWNKYKSLFESKTGVPLHKKSRLEFSIIGKQSNKRYKAF